MPYKPCLDLRIILYFVPECASKLVFLLQESCRATWFELGFWSRDSGWRVE